MKRNMSSDDVTILRFLPKSRLTSSCACATLPQGMERIEHESYGRRLGRILVQVLRNASSEPLFPWNDDDILVIGC